MEGPATLVILNILFIGLITGINPVPGYKSDDLFDYYELTNKKYDEYYQEELEPPRAEAMMEVELLEEEEKVGPTLGRVLGICSIIVIVFYVLGMAFKLYKIWKGEYVEEEPVFLKYK